MARRRPQPEGPGRKVPPGYVTRRRQPRQGLSPPRSLRGGTFRPGALTWDSRTVPKPVVPADGFKNIAVLRLSSLGDVVLTLPVVHALARTFPGARLHYWVKEE